MRFFWQKSWVPAVESGLSRRTFVTGLAAALAAPVVVKSGVLMPVRKLIVPEAPAGWLEVSWDGEEWLASTQISGPPGTALLSLSPHYAGGWLTRVRMTDRHTAYGHVLVPMSPEDVGEWADEVRSREAAMLEQMRQSGGSPLGLPPVFS